jgi:hypothetical protein
VRDWTVGGAQPCVWARLGSAAWDACTVQRCSTSPCFGSSPQARRFPMRVFQAFSFSGRRFHIKDIISRDDETVALASSRAHWVDMVIVNRDPDSSSRCCWYRRVIIPTGTWEDCVSSSRASLLPHHIDVSVDSRNGSTCPGDDQTTALEIGNASHHSFTVQLETDIAPSARLCPSRSVRPSSAYASRSGT